MSNNYTKSRVLPAVILTAALVVATTTTIMIGSSPIQQAYTFQVKDLSKVPKPPSAITRVGGDIRAGGASSLVELEKPHIAPSSLISAPIATSGSYVYVAWPSNKTGNLEIMFRASSDNGKTFAPKINLSNSTGTDSVDEEMAASGNNVYVTWWELQQNGTRTPMFIASNDNGKTFGEKIMINSNGSSTAAGKSS
jgi:hypothetical protein